MRKNTKMSTKLFGIVCTVFLLLGNPLQARTITSVPMTGSAVIAGLFDWSDDRDDTIAKQKKTISDLNKKNDDLKVQAKALKSQMEDLVDADNALLWCGISSFCSLIIGFILGAFYTMKSISRTLPDK